MALFKTSLFGGKPNASLAPDLQPAKVRRKNAINEELESEDEQVSADNLEGLDNEDELGELNELRADGLDDLEGDEGDEGEDLDQATPMRRRLTARRAKQKANAKDLSQTLSALSSMARASSWVLNRYVLTGAAFVVFMLLFDRNDLITQRAVVNQRQALEERITWHKAELSKLHRERRLLMSDKAALERFAREQYKMKRDNEDLFLIVHEKTTVEE